MRVPSYHGAKRWHVCDHAVPIYSLELELVAQSRGELVRQLRAQNFQKVSWETDGSLPRDTGLEILVQLRSSLQELYSDTVMLFKTLRGGYGVQAWGYTVDGSPQCGIHINCNRDARWSKLRVMRMLYIVDKSRMLLIKIAGRNSNRWARFPSSDRNKLSTWASGHYDKYVAIRVGGDRFEWRLFRSTLSCSRFKLYCDTIQFVETLACSDISSKKLRDAAASGLTKLYNDFISKNHTHVSESHSL